MTGDVACAGSALPQARRAGDVREVGRAAPDLRRVLQLALAGLWLLDALLQFQSFMFSRGFAHMVGSAAAGSPAFVADPIRLTAGMIAAHPAATNCAFAILQLLLGLGIAWRPSLRLALAASIAWSAAVWWLAENLGGMLSGSASVIAGAPGAAVLYALLAILLWPSRPADGTITARPAAGFAAGQFTGGTLARAAWLAVWGSLAALALGPAASGAGAIGRLVTASAAGQPGWLATADEQLGGYLLHRGPAMAFALAAALATIAVGVYLPVPAVRATLVLAVLAAAAIWLAGGLGGILTGSGTDPGAGPLLALLAISYWPIRSHTAARVDGPA